MTGTGWFDTPADRLGIGERFLDFFLRVAPPRHVDNLQHMLVIVNRLRDNSVSSQSCGPDRTPVHCGSTQPERRQWSCGRSARPFREEWREAGSCSRSLGDASSDTYAGLVGRGFEPLCAVPLEEDRAALPDIESLFDPYIYSNDSRRGGGICLDEFDQCAPVSEEAVGSVSERRCSISRVITSPEKMSAMACKTSSSVSAGAYIGNPAHRTALQAEAYASAWT